MRWPSFGFMRTVAYFTIVHGIADAYAGDHLTSLAEHAKQARDFVLGRIGEGGAKAHPRTHVFLMRGPDHFRALWCITLRRPLVQAARNIESVT